MQAAHAAHEVALKYPYLNDEPSFLIALGVKNQNQLDKAHAHVESHGINTVMFSEPDYDYGHTAFATQAVLEDQRHVFKKYNLWKPKGVKPIE